MSTREVNSLIQNVVGTDRSPRNFQLIKGGPDSVDEPSIGDDDIELAASMLPEEPQAKVSSDGILKYEFWPWESYISQGLLSSVLSNTLANKAAKSKTEASHMDDWAKAILSRQDQDIRDHKQEMRDRDERLARDAAEREERYHRESVENERRYTSELKHHREIIDLKLNTMDVKLDNISKATDVRRFWIGTIITLAVAVFIGLGTAWVTLHAGSPAIYIGQPSGTAK